MKFLNNNSRLVVFIFVYACIEPFALAEHANLPVMNVDAVLSSSGDSMVIQPETLSSADGDIAQMLRYAPGASVNSNGALTGIAQYRGMYGDRVNVLIDGVKISSGGPNAMDPSLSYLPAARLEALELYRGIAPVRSGNETIGGTINAYSMHSEFGDSNTFDDHGVLSLGGQSVNSSYWGSGLVSIANKHHRFQALTSIEKGDDLRFNSGRIIPSEHDRKNYGLGYGFKSGEREIAVDYLRRDSGKNGTPALPMDILKIDSDVASIHLQDQWGKAEINSKVYYSKVDHEMSNFGLRDAPIMRMPNGMQMPMRRLAITDSQDYGYGIDVEIPLSSGSFIFGTDAHLAEHNANIFNPGSSSFIVNNFSDIKRDVFGLYGQWKHQLNMKNQYSWTMDVGLRYTRINMDANKVSATGFPMAMLQMNANQLAAQFNAADRKQNDNNIDATISFSKPLNDQTKLIVAVARKTRSPSYQERYLWLPLQSTGGLADGNNYVGNVNLKSEKAYQFELGFDTETVNYYVSPRLFYHQVDDYIQGVNYTGGGSAQMFHNMMTTMTGSSARLLQFSNVDAKLYGTDLEWGIYFNEDWRVNGVLSYVRGQRRDTGDNLYRIAPLSTTMAITREAKNWSTTLEALAVAKQDDVSAVNNEKPTDGYILLNIYSNYSFDDRWTVKAGVNNLLDKYYVSHLGGYSRVNTSDLNVGERLPESRISAFISANYKW